MTTGTTARSRQTARALLTAIALLAATAFTLRPHAASAVQPTVVLTSTLQVASGDAVRYKHFVWNGPSNEPVIQLKGSKFAVLEHVVVTVPDGWHASAAIQFDADPTLGEPFGNHVRDVKLGAFFAPGRYGYGIRINAGTSNTFTNITSHGAEVANVSIADTDATGNSFRGQYMIVAPVNFESKAKGTTVCQNCGFIRGDTRDVHLTDGAGLFLSGMYSEQSRSFAHVEAGAAGGGLTVLGGYWMWTHGAPGATTLVGSNPGGHRTWLRITDFLLTPIDSLNHGSVRGFASHEKYYSNVWGLTDEEAATPGTGITRPGFIDFIYPIGTPGGAPPDTVVTAAPSSPTTATTATFRFTGTDDRHVPEDLFFQCSLDGAAFTACLSPVSYTGLALGGHTFQVRAVDRSGNVDPSPAAHTWNVT